MLCASAETCAWGGRVPVLLNCRFHRQIRWSHESMEASKVVCNCSFRPYFRGNRFMRTFTVGCFAAFALAFSAPAATIDSDFPVAQGGNWAYPVSLNISSGESITTGNFFTIFDVPGLLNAA